MANRESLAGDSDINTGDINPHEINTLRQVAQQHLEEIEAENKQEQEQEMRRLAELEHESRRRTSAQSSNEAKVKGARMRTAQDVLNRLRWAGDMDISQYQVGYLDRFGGCLERSAADWINDSTEEEWIPQHRIRYFKKTTVGGTEIVWDRDQRVDKVFGSVNTTNE